MAKMSDWVISMEEETVRAIENGASSQGDVVASVRTALGNIDDDWVMQYYEELMVAHEADKAVQLDQSRADSRNAKRG